MTGSRLTVPCSGARSQRMLGSIPRAAPSRRPVGCGCSSPLAPAQGKDTDTLGSWSHSLGHSARQLCDGREGREAEHGHRQQLRLKYRARRLRGQRGTEPEPEGGTAWAGSSVRCHRVRQNHEVALATCAGWWLPGVALKASPASPRSWDTERILRSPAAGNGIILPPTGQLCPYPFPSPVLYVPLSRQFSFMTGRLD